MGLDDRWSPLFPEPLLLFLFAKMALLLCRAVAVIAPMKMLLLCSASMLGYGGRLMLPVDGLRLWQARHTDGQLSVGVAVATSPLGPFTDVGEPLVHENDMGHIGALPLRSCCNDIEVMLVNACDVASPTDPTFYADGGQNYLIWKEVRHHCVVLAAMVAMLSYKWR